MTGMQPDQKPTISGETTSEGKVQTSAPLSQGQRLETYSSLIDDTLKLLTRWFSYVRPGSQVILNWDGHLVEVSAGLSSLTILIDGTLCISSQRELLQELKS